MIDNCDFTLLFESYNRTMQTVCEEELMNIDSKKGYEQLIRSAREKFEDTLIDGKKPSSCFEGIVKREQLPAVFEKAVEICDEFVPISLISTINRLNAAEMIEEFAFGKSELVLQATAIRTLPFLEKGEYREKLADVIKETDEDLIKEVARQALTELNEPVVDFLIEKLQKETLEEDDYHFLMALVDIDKDRKSDRVYYALKDCFSKAGDKSMVARCLVDYNDKRAVVFLRGYLKKNLNSSDEMEQQEIREAIRKLGGREDDIKN